MLYNKESGKIKIGLWEFVSISRRGISPTLPFDEDEPTLRTLSKSRIRAILGTDEPQKLLFGFTFGEYSFELLCEADAISENKISLVREISSNPAKPRKEDVSQIRGEAFVIGHALASLYGYESIVLDITYVNKTSGEMNTVTEFASSRCLPTSMRTQDS